VQAASSLPRLSASARATLDRALATEPGWVGIHAAEALVATGEAARVRQWLLDRLDHSDASSSRTGPWRVLARCAVAPEERARWIARIEAVLVDPDAADRPAALECLAKLGHPLSPPGREVARQMAADPREAETLVPLWALQLSGERDALPRIRQALTSADPVSRRRAGYVLRWLKVTDPVLLAALARAADAEPPGTDTQTFLLSAALQLGADPSRAAAWQAELVRVLTTGSTASRYEASQALAGRFPASDLSQLAVLLHHPEGDVRIGAALIILAGDRDR
jgi:hypothetical protein